MATRSLLTIENFNAVAAAIVANKGVVIDTHNNRRTEMQAAGIAALIKGDRVTPVLLCQGAYFSLNTLSVEKDGSVELSTWSTGGVVMVDRHGGLQEAILAYNEEIADLPVHSGTLEHVKLFFYDHDEAKTLHVVEMDKDGNRTGEQALMSSKHHVA